MLPKCNMKRTCNNLRTSGLTLVEVLTGVAIIAILASILVPVLAKQKIKAKAKLAKLDCSSIAQAITQYNMDNIGRFPSARGEQANTKGGDITFSMHDNGPTGAVPHNGDLMIILSAIESLGGNNVNAGHARNSKKFNYLQSKLTSSKEKPGMGPDGIYRDPFGNPYVVTVDKSGDGKCYDFFYGDGAVSGTGGQIGANGLMKETLPNGVSGYILTAKAMVWSAGPDREVSPGQGALEGKNYDNIIGW